MTLKNFLSYGEHVYVDFQPYSLICLSGKNGNGKSALLDAITWTLWGNARKIGGVPRADEHLIRLGQHHMLVVFEFMSNDRHYRVRRETTISHGKLFATLEFGLFDATGAIKPLTQKSIRATQECIQSVIGLTFDAFSNSVFLRQGHSDEFSRKSAQERKEILGTILGLDRFEQARKLATEKVRATQAEIDGLHTLYEHVRQQSAQLPSVRKTVDTVDRCVHESTQTQERIRTQLATCATHKEELARTKEHAYTLQQKLATINEQRARLEHEITLQHAHILNAHKIAYTRLAEQECAFDERVVALTQQLQILNTQHATQEQRIKESRIQYYGAQRAQEALTQRTQLFEKRKTLFHTLAGESTWMHKHVQLITHEHLPIVQQQNSQCPLCEQSLTPKRQHFLTEKLHQQAHFYEHRLQRVNSFVQSSRSVLASEKKELDALSAQAHSAQQVQERLREYEEHLAHIVQEQTLLAQQLQHVAHEQQQCVQQKHKARTQLEQEQQRAHQLIHADARWSSLTKEHAALMQQQREMQSLEELQQQERTLARTEQELQHELHAAHTMHAHIIQEYARAQQEYERLEKLVQQEEQERARIQDLERMRDEYKIIAQALSKDGVQALLIESVIPELENEANKILAHLSDQNAHIIIESLRDLKSGGTRETLDIKIADNAGIRPYELFSGGEAFRIDFALRIAISTLLARRAGAHLQTIIIDEGFGSQDEDGLQRLIDALHKIQDHFAKIIIVSHLSSLKEQFPVHFIVEKQAHGSTVRVVRYD